MCVCPFGACLHVYFFISEFILNTYDPIMSRGNQQCKPEFELIVDIEMAPDGTRALLPGACSLRGCADERKRARECGRSKESRSERDRRAENDTIIISQQCDSVSPLTHTHALARVQRRNGSRHFNDPKTQRGDPATGPGKTFRKTTKMRAKRARRGTARQDATRLANTRRCTRYCTDGATALGGPCCYAHSAEPPVFCEQTTRTQKNVRVCVRVCVLIH